MSRRLADLAPHFRPLAVELIAQLAERGIAVCIVGTGRTTAEQAAAFARGASHVRHSLHEDGLAIDLCPYEEYKLHGPDKLRWDPRDPSWVVLGAVGESLGLRWGGRWTTLYDPGHLELSTHPPIPATPL
jgi:peptidoglycan L-alanyl-D-glutamate endopeptidase CwlK